MDRKPKERIVFDDSWYYGDEGRDYSIEDLAGRDEIDIDEAVETYSEDQIFENAMALMNLQYDEEMTALKHFFNGEESAMSLYINPIGKNTILVRGSVSRWDGTSSGIAAYPDFEHATDCSSSYGSHGSVFADCEIDKVWDENGALFVTGAHHDGRATVEMRQLTDKGQALYSDCVDYEGNICIEEEIRAMGKTYRDGDEGKFIHDLWNDPEMCVKPRYCELAFGNPAEEWVEVAVEKDKSPVELGEDAKKAAGLTARAPHEGVSQIRKPAGGAI